MGRFRGRLTKLEKAYPDDRPGPPAGLPLTDLGWVDWDALAGRGGVPAELVGRSPMYDPVEDLINAESGGER